MSDWSDKFKLGKSAFIKKDLRLLPLTESEFDVDFFFDHESSSKNQERWIGLVIEREFGGLLAMEDVTLPPPTVNDLANQTVATFVDTKLGSSHLLHRVMQRVHLAAVFYGSPRGHCHSALVPRRMSS